MVVFFRPDMHSVIEIVLDEKLLYDTEDFAQIKATRYCIPLRTVYGTSALHKAPPELAIHTAVY